MIVECVLLSADRQGATLLRLIDRTVERDCPGFYNDAS